MSLGKILWVAGITAFFKRVASLLPRPRRPDPGMQMESAGSRASAACVACALLSILPGSPCLGESPAPLIVTYRPMKPEIFFFSDVPHRLMTELLPPELVGPPLTCFRPDDETVRQALEAADEAVSAAGEPAALAAALLRRGAVVLEAENLRCDLEYDRYDEAVRQYEKGGGGESPTLPACPDSSAALADWQQAVAACPDFPGRDKAIYLAATELERSGRLEEAASLAERVKSEHPESALVFDSMLLAGLALYTSDELDEARERFEVAAQASPSRALEPLYMIAWIDLRRWSYLNAAIEFLNLIERARTAVDMDRRNVGPLVEEAIESVAWMLASDDWDGDGLSDVTRIAERTLGVINDAQEDALPLLRAVLEQIADSGGREREDFVALSLAYLERYPLTADAPVRHDALVHALDLRTEDRSESHEQRCQAGRQALSERKRMGDLYAAGGEWRRIHEADIQAVSKADELVHRAMTERALLLHRRAQDIRMMEVDGKASGASRPWYCRAQRAYIELIERFPDSTEQCNVRRGIGEAAFFGTWNEAEALQLLVPVRDDPRCPDWARNDAADLARRLEERSAAAPAGDVPAPPCSSPEDESDEHGFCLADDYSGFASAPEANIVSTWDERYRASRVAQRRSSELARCAQEACRGGCSSDNRLVNVDVSVQANGRGVVHADSGGASGSLERCIERQVSSWRFPKPEAAPMNVEFKVALVPE